MIRWGARSDVNVKNNDGWTPLHSAAYYGHFEIVKYLVEHGADIIAKNNDGLTPLQCAESKDNEEIVEYLSVLCS